MVRLIQLIPLTPEQCHEQWGWLRNGILHCAEKTHARYLPEDVYAKIRAGSAWCYVIHNGDDIGFFILTQDMDPDGLVMFVWVMWMEPGAARPLDKQIYDALESLARSIKAKRIRMQSPRKGWERQQFFDRVAVIYEHEIFQ